MNRAIEELKARMIFGQEVPDDIVGIEESGLEVPGATDLGGPIEEVAPDLAPQLGGVEYDRSAEVRDAVGALRASITQVIQAVFQMQLTEEQLAELTETAMINIHDAVNEVTLERVKEIVPDQLVSEK